jgi:hypothetical protein
LKATENLTTVEKRPSAWHVATALDILDDHLEQLNSLALVLEGRLADLCQSEPDEHRPLIEWRMSQVLRDMLSSTDVQNNIKAHLREPAAAAAVPRGVLQPA